MGDCLCLPSKAQDMASAKSPRVWVGPLLPPARTKADITLDPSPPFLLYLMSLEQNLSERGS